MFISACFSDAYANIARSVGNLNTRLIGRCVLLFALALASALGLGGCSLTRISYPALPTLAQWEINRYVDLDDAQRAIVSRHLERVLQWHRGDELPRYARFLRGLDERVRGRVDAAEVARTRDRVGQAWELLADRLAPAVAELALTLRPEQIAQMRERADELQTKARERYLPEKGESPGQARAKRVIKRAEFFLGDLSDAQTAELRRLVAALPAADEAWLAEREARQRAFIAMLDRLRAQRPPLVEASRIAGEHLRTMWESRDPVRRGQLAESVAASDALSAHLIERADADQRRYLSKLLRGYAEDFEALALTVQTARRSD